MSYDFDEKTVSIIGVLYDRGGSASTSDVKSALGYEDYEIRYRFEKLEENDLVEKSQADEAKKGIPPLIATLTEKAEEEIQKGELGDVYDSVSPDEVTVTREQIEEFKDGIERLENRIDAMGGFREDDSTDNEIERLEAKIEKVEEDLEESLRWIKNIESNLDELNDRVTSIEESSSQEIDIDEEVLNKFINETNEMIPIVGGLYNAVNELLEDDLTVEDFQ